MMESLKIEAKRIQLDLLKEDVKTLEKTLEEKLSKFSKEEETRNNTRKHEALKQINIILNPFSYHDQKVMGNIREECITLTDTNKALKG